MLFQNIHNVSSDAFCIPGFFFLHFCVFVDSLGCFVVYGMMGKTNIYIHLS